MSFSLSAAAMRCFGSDPEVGASRSHVRSTPRTRRRRRHGAGQLGYWKAETPNVRSGWYITGDTMMRDEDNHFSFVGRNDDIITSSGYRIGPIDVESVVMSIRSVGCRILQKGGLLARDCIAVTIQSVEACATAPLSPAIASMQLNWSGCPIVAGKLCNLHGINYSPSQAWIEIAHRPFIEINDPNQALG